MGKWPKKFPELTAEQIKIRDDFMRLWHESFESKGKLSYRFFEWMSHSYTAVRIPSGGRVLELGAGLGAHIPHEDLGNCEYHAVELRAAMADEIKRRYPCVTVHTGDCQEGLDFPDAYFDKVVAVNVFEHLPDLPKAIAESRRLLKPAGLLCIVIPCEGEFMYSVARKISAERLFKKLYNGMDYSWLVKSEHINMADEVMDELRPHFEVVRKRYIPFLVPSVSLNLSLGLILRPRRA
jgi:SAM-dependent methyltransferase